MPNLRNRLAVAVLKDLEASAPKTFNALSNWECHAGFWLAELAECPRNPDQLTYWTGLLGMALIREHTDLTFAEACTSLRNHMRMHQVLKEGA